ncbi:MAG TPA: NADH-quinone oxidoreductase subunit N, partial [Roseiflexaceae bacterium]|nr:NADH-quinone oxidoreductase subunit N [Roseiflexaceae bacterium]
MTDLQIPPVDIAVVLPLLIVAGWASVLLLIDLAVAQKRITAYLAIAGLVVAALAGIPQWGAARATFGGMLVLDNYALILNWIFLLIGVLSILIAVDYLPRHGIERGEFYPLMMFATTGMMLLVQGGDLIVLFLGLEMLS